MSEAMREMTRLRIHVLLDFIFFFWCVETYPRLLQSYYETPCIRRRTGVRSTARFRIKQDILIYSTNYYKRRNDHLLANHADLDSSQIYLSIQVESLNVRQFSSKSSVFSDKSTLQDFPSSRFRNVCTRPNDHGEY